MGKFTKYPAKFWKKIQLNAGIVVEGFNPTDMTFTAIMGATSNGTTFNPNPTYDDFGSDIDNVQPNTKQFKRLRYYDPSLAGTFRTIDPERAAQLCPGVDASGVITPASVLTDDMFVDVTLLADYTEVNDDDATAGATAGYMAVTVKNALNTTGFQWKTNKDGKGEFPFDFHGHYDLDDPDAAPFELHVIDAVRPVVLSVTSEAGTDSGDSKITVSGYTLKTGESYVYKTGATAPAVSHGDDVSTWDALTNGGDITPATGHTAVTVAVKDAEGKAAGSGSAALVIAE